MAARVKPGRVTTDDDALASAGPPSFEAPLSYDADVRIPAPPILPTPASMGMDSLTLPARDAGRGPASEVRALRPKAGAKAQSSTGRTGVRIGVGVGVGVIVSLAVVLAYLLRA